jgi:hypothetical protein
MEHRAKYKREVRKKKLKIEKKKMSEWTELSNE